MFKIRFDESWRDLLGFFLRAFFLRTSFVIFGSIFSSGWACSKIASQLQRGSKTFNLGKKRQLSDLDACPFLDGRSSSSFSLEGSKTFLTCGRSDSRAIWMRALSLMADLPHRFLWRGKLIPLVFQAAQKASRAKSWLESPIPAVSSFNPHLFPWPKLYCKIQETYQALWEPLIFGLES